VGSAVNALEGGVGFDLVQHYDTALSFDVLGGYDWNQSAAEIDPRLCIKKKLTVNTFAETGIAFPFYLKRKFNQTPTFLVEGGFTF
ncbi:MAG: hypothetical protein ACREFR_06390, partial [Limisphaerales bacterium]